jgi:hypothetical protein
MPSPNAGSSFAGLTHAPPPGNPTFDFGPFLTLDVDVHDYYFDVHWHPVVCDSCGAGHFIEGCPLCVDPPAARIIDVRADFMLVSGGVVKHLSDFTTAPDYLQVFVRGDYEPTGGTQPQPCGICRHQFGCLADSFSHCEEVLPWSYDWRFDWQPDVEDVPSGQLVWDNLPTPTGGADSLGWDTSFGIAEPDQRHGWMKRRTRSLAAVDGGGIHSYDMTDAPVYTGDPTNPDIATLFTYAELDEIAWSLPSGAGSYGANSFRIQDMRLFPYWLQWSVPAARRKGWVV